MVGVASRWFLIVRDETCPTCGLAASSVPQGELGSAIVAEGRRWVRLLDSLGGGPALRVRPSRSVWSVLEYAGHTRDTLALFGDRVELALAVDDPQFGYQDQDRAVEDGRYNDQDPGAIARGLLANAERFALLLATLPEGGWRRTGTRLEGERFDGPVGTLRAARGAASSNRRDTFVANSCPRGRSAGPPDTSAISAFLGVERLATSLRIAVIGDFRADRETHRATSAAPAHAAAEYGWELDATWIATPALEGGASDVLAAFDGVWIAPGSPYRSLQGALAAIRVAREARIPLIGTCGGFQHLILEYARNVLGIADAHHAEYDPDASRLFITPLTCSLAGRSMKVQLCAGTKAASAYGTPTAAEHYYCSFGLNPDCLDDLKTGGLVVSGVDQDGEVRIVELPAHPFFLATLFVPQVSSSPGSPHPLVAAFVTAAATHKART
jgi:hypothetical protein